MNERENEMNELQHDLKTLSYELTLVRFFQAIAWMGWCLIGVPAGLQWLLNYNLNQIPADVLPIVNRQILGVGIVVFAGYTLFQLLLVIWNLDVVTHQDLITWRLKKVFGGALLFVGFEGFGLVNNHALNLMGGYVGAGCALIYVLARLGNRQMTQQVADQAHALKMPMQKTITWSKYQIGHQKITALSEHAYQEKPRKWWHFKHNRDDSHRIKVHQP